jgi:hypothetical protein
MNYVIYIDVLVLVAWFNQRGYDREVVWLQENMKYIYNFGEEAFSKAATSNTQQMGMSY